MITKPKTTGENIVRSHVQYNSNILNFFSKLTRTRSGPAGAQNHHLSHATVYRMVAIRTWKLGKHVLSFSI